VPKENLDGSESQNTSKKKGWTTLDPKNRRHVKRQKKQEIKESGRREYVCYIRLKKKNREKNDEGRRPDKRGGGFENDKKESTTFSLKKGTTCRSRPGRREKKKEKELRLKQE